MILKYFWDSHTPGIFRDLTKFSEVGHSKDSGSVGLGTPRILKQFCGDCLKLGTSDSQRILSRDFQEILEGVFGVGISGILKGFLWGLSGVGLCTDSEVILLGFSAVSTRGLRGF